MGYAIPLQELQAEAEKESHGHTDVLLQTTLGDVEYRFRFNTKEDKDIVSNFLTSVCNASTEASIEAKKKELGHEHQINPRASTVYANQVAQEKTKDQPDAPINVNMTEAMTDYPTPFPVA